MKKSKSKSKPKQKSQALKQSGMMEQEIEVKCGVCRTLVKPHHQAMTCEECKRVTHVACYNSEQPGSRKNFTCDMCKNKKRRQFCILCRQYGDFQILKSLEGNSAYIHVECAILSPHVEVSSYSKLGFIARGDLEKTNKHTVMCSACGLTGSGVIVGCTECQKKAHFRCWIAELGDQNYVLYRWLDKLDKYDFLLHYVLTKKKTNLKTIVDVPTKLKQLQLVLCSEHIQNYPFCYCNNWALSQHREHEDYQCEQCQRWIHQPCSGLPPNSQQSFKCQGCRQGNIFKRQLKLHDLLTEIAKIQKSQKLNQKSIKLLNAFPLKYSGQLEKRIMESLKQIDVYFAKKQISKILQSEGNQEKKRKKIIQLLLVINYGDKWKESEAQLQKEDSEFSRTMSHLLNFKTGFFDKEIEQKILELLRPKAVKTTKQHTSLQEQLKNFIKQFRSFSVTNSKEAEAKLALAIREIQIKFSSNFENSEENERKFITKFNEVMGNEIFGFLISRKQISLEIIKLTLAKITKIKYYSLKEQYQISEEEYNSIAEEPSTAIPQSQRAVWADVTEKLKGSLKKFQVIFDSVKKEQLYKKYLGQIKDVHNIQPVNKIEAQCLKDQICTINNEGVFMALKMKVIEENAMKKKILSICRKKDYHLTEGNFLDIIKVQQFLKKKSHLFSLKELQQVNSHIGKLQFLLSILKKGESLQQYLIYDQPSNEEMINQNGPNNIGIVFLKLFHILDNWDERILPAEYFITEFFTKCVQKKVKFTHPLVQERLKAFMRFISNRYYNAIEEGRKIYSSILKRFVKVFEYLNMERQFTYFIDLHEKVKKWSNLFTGEERPENISAALQKPEKAANILRIVDLKIMNTSEIDRVNLSVELSKLCLLRQWCRLTEKILLLFKSKATINSIQNLKSLMEKVQYPQNLLHKKVVQLETESKNLNKEVIKFLQKPRVSDHMGFYDEMKFVCSKMLLEEGYTIKSILDKCNLDVYVQTQELENQIKQFELLPNQLGFFSEKKTLLQLNLTRRKLLDSCFRVSNVEEYEKFLRRIYILRCQNFEPPILKEQYFQLLTVGGAAAIQFQAKTSELLKAYRTIEKAELQISNPANKKKNFNNLIPWSEQKCREMRQALKFDPMELMKFQRARIINAKVRDQYIQMRARKCEAQKYKEIQFDLTNSIFSNREILGEISVLRCDLERLVRRVQQFLPYQQPFSQLIIPDNIFKRERTLLQTYNAIKIKHPSLEKFEFDYRMYFHTEQLRPSINMQNYKTYCDVFSRMSDLACRIPEIVATRTMVFIQVYKEAMKDDKPPLLLCHTLIQEGLEIRRLGSIQKDLIFDMVLQIYSHLKEIQQQKESESESQMQQGKRQRDYDDEDDDDDDDDDGDEGMDDQDDDEDDDDQDDDEVGHIRNMDDDSDEPSPDDKGKSSKGGNNQIVLDSDS